MDDPEWKLQRPRQIYMGPEEKDYLPMKKRGGEKSRK
jgi:citrate synthase